MKDSTAAIYKEKHLGWWAAGASALSSVLMLLMGPVQDTGDDAMLAWLMARGDGSVAAFISPYLSMAESLLFRLAGQIPWWSITLFAGGAALLYVLFRLSFSCRTWLTRTLAALFSFAGVWLCIVRTLNFTRSAAAYAMAGLLLILQGVAAEKRGERIAGLALFLLGCAIRLEAGCLQVPFFLLCLLGLAYQEGGAQLRRLFACVKEKKYWLSVGGVGLMLLCVIGGAKLFQSQNPEYKVYEEYSQARANITDYQQEYPSWDEAEEAYIAAGLTDETDWELLSGCAFITDPDVFTLETLQNIVQLKHSSLSTAQRLVQAVKKNYWAVLDGTMTWLSAAAVLTLLLLFRKKAILPLLFSFGGAGIMLLWVAYRGRMVLRVWEPVVFAAIVASAVLCLILDGAKDTKKGLRAATLALCAAAIAASGMVGEMVSLQWPNAQWDRDPMMASRGQQMASDSDNLYYLNWSFIHNSPEPAPFGLWEAAGTNVPDNFFALNNWDANSPYNLHKLSALGIDNQVQSMLQRTDVKSDYDPKVSHYMNTHYGPRVTTTAIDTFADGLPIVQYTAPIDVTAAGTSGGRATISESGIVENYSAWWLRITGTVTLSDSEDAVYYCNLLLDGEAYTCRISPDAEGNFHSDVLVEGGDTAWVLGDIFTRTADGQLLLLTQG